MNDLNIVVSRHLAPITPINDLQKMPIFFTVHTGNLLGFLDKKSIEVTIFKLFNVIDFNSNSVRR